jgi:cytochrome b pre-mRNA-processing protein 3
LLKKSQQIITSGVKKLMNWCTSSKIKNDVSKLYQALAIYMRKKNEEIHLEPSIQMRFEWVSLHMSFILIKLKDEKEFSQALFDYMFDDFDACFRELGVSDLRVGKYVKSYAEHFYARLEAYDKITQDILSVDEALVNFFQVSLSSELSEQLKNYINLQKECINSIEKGSLLKGQIPFR